MLLKIETSLTTIKILNLDGDKKKRINGLKQIIKKKLIERNVFLGINIFANSLKLKFTYFFIKLKINLRKICI